MVAFLLTPFRFLLFQGKAGGSAPKVLHQQPAELRNLLLPAELVTSEGGYNGNWTGHTKTLRRLSGKFDDA